MKIFLTGGCGFIGSALACRLLADGHNVTVFDNMSVGSVKFLRDTGKNARVRIINGDVANFSRVNKSIKGHDFVYHLAANANLPLGVANTRIDLESNLIGTYNILECMRRHRISSIAFTSSSAVYGEPPKSSGPISEDYASLEPISLYGASKLGAEAYVTAFHHMFGLKAWI